MQYGRSMVRMSVTVCLLVGGLGGCVRGPINEQHPAPAAATNMVKAGYAAIADRFLAPVTGEQIALNGMHGISDLDPALSVGRIGSTLYLRASGEAIAVEPAPGAQDIDGWARVTVDLWQRAYAVSPAVRAAGEEGAYRALLLRAIAALDPHGRYADPAEARANRQRRDGYLGIGASFRIEDGHPFVSEVIGGGPAERAGLRVGDAIIRINDWSVGSTSPDALVERLAEAAPGRVRITVRRTGREGVLQLSVGRTYLIQDTVSERYEDGILFLAISRFNQGTAAELDQTLQALASGFGDGLRGVIVDLRGNPGGLLQQAVKIADLFLDAGPVLETRGRNPESTRSYASGGADALRSLPLVILVDGRSASAAELLAAALQDRRRAVLVGSSSYGKGGVQTVVPLPNGGELSVTWSEALPPSGESLHGRGVTPAVCTSGLYFADDDAIERVLQRSRFGSSAPAAASACPAEPRDGTVDPDVARRLISDRALFADLLQRDPMLAVMPAQTHP